MSKRQDNKSLQKYINGRYSFNDFMNVKQWLENIDKYEDIKDQLGLQFEELTNQNLSGGKELGSLYEKIEYKILKQERQSPQKLSLLGYFQKVAAVLIIPILISSVYFYLNNFETPSQEKQISWVEVNSPDGARTEFLLPDGSRGWLAGGSKIKYNPSFIECRNVILSGEAFFDVEHKHDNSEFVVSIPDMDIKVLGTRFNVSAYSDDNFSEVVLEEGKVEIDGKSKIFHQILKPSEKLNFHLEKETVVLTQVDTKPYTAWKDGYLVLNNDPLEQAIDQIERWYNVEIEIDNELLKKYRFKATFKNEQLEDVLEMLSITTPIDYEIEERRINNNGIYMKKKVRLRLK